nr:hypothetical protein [Tanacetum cinerariifolium]
MSKKKTIDSFYKPKTDVVHEPETQTRTQTNNDVSEVHTFFKHLNFIVNVIGSLTKRNDRLQDAQLAKISHLAEIGELESGRGANQMQSLQRPGDTRWSSHFKSICSLVKLFGLTRVLLSLSWTVYKFSKSIPVPDMSASYKDRIQSRSKKDNVTAEYHYQVDVFIVAIDSLLQELNNRFSESVLELLRLSVTLYPKKSFNADDISKLVTKYYPFGFYRIRENWIQITTSCKGLQKTKKTKKSEICPLVDRLIRLILTLHVSTATSERAFLKMKLVKTRLCSTMSDDFLKSSMILSI